MADYAKITLNAVYSENNDYSNPRTKLQATTQLTPTAFASNKINVPHTYMSLYDIVPYDLTSVDQIIVHNTDATNYVTVSWLALIHSTPTIANPGGTGFTFDGGAGTITDNRSTSSFTQASVGDYLHNNNAAHTDNQNKNMLITGIASANQVTVATSLTQSANDTSVSFTLNRNQNQRVPPGGILAIPGNILIDTVYSRGNELGIIANSGTCSCNVMVFGS